MLKINKQRRNKQTNKQKTPKKTSINVLLWPVFSRDYFTSVYIHQPKVVCS